MDRAEGQPRGARPRQHPLGSELVVMVGQDIGWSRLYRDHEDSRTLGDMAEGCRLDFERLGWRTNTRDAGDPARSF